MSDVDIKDKIGMLFKYGFRLTPGELFKNKTGSVILQRGPGNGGTTNINVMIDGISVGYYSEWNGKFVYSGGSALREAFPERRIQSTFSDLLRRHLDQDHGEFGSKGLPEHYPSDYMYCNEFRPSFAALDALGLFMVEKRQYDLGFYQVDICTNQTIAVYRASNRELLFTLGPGPFHVYSNRVSTEVVLGILYYLLAALGLYWVNSGILADEPKKWDWDDPIAGSRRLSIVWLAWNEFIKKGTRDPHYIIDYVDYAIRSGTSAVCTDLEQEHGVRPGSYKAETDCKTLKFVVYQNNPSVVY